MNITSADEIYFRQLDLTFAFNAMLTHRLSPDSMLNGTMIPIPKGKGKAII